MAASPIKDTRKVLSERFAYLPISVTRHLHIGSKCPCMPMARMFKCPSAGRNIHLSGTKVDAMPMDSDTRFPLTRAQPARLYPISKGIEAVIPWPLLHFVGFSYRYRMQKEPTFPSLPLGKSSFINRDKKPGPYCAVSSSSVMPPGFINMIHPHRFICPIFSSSVIVSSVGHPFSTERSGSYKRYSPNRGAGSGKNQSSHRQ
jgi:hypothetical protein